MNRWTLFLRTFALFLSVALAAPAPSHDRGGQGLAAGNGEASFSRSHALRPLNAGAEESPTSASLQRRLKVSRHRWTVEKVLEAIRRASASQRPKLSLAPGAIRSQSQRGSALGAKLYHAYQAVVARESFPDDLPDWPAALRRAGEDPTAHYRRRFSAGAEEAVDHSLSAVREAVQGSGVAVIDAAIFPQQAGLEQLLKRLPVGNRIVVVGTMEGSAAMQEIRARNRQIQFADSLESAMFIILTLPAADTVSILGADAFARALQADLRQFMIEAFQIDHRLGLSVLLLALGVSEDLLRQLDWNSVESALSSLEAA